MTQIIVPQNQMQNSQQQPNPSLNQQFQNPNRNTYQTNPVQNQVQGQYVQSMPQQAQQQIQKDFVAPSVNTNTNPPSQQIYSQNQQQVPIQLNNNSQLNQPAINASNQNQSNLNQQSYSNLPTQQNANTYTVPAQNYQQLPTTNNQNNNLTPDLQHNFNNQNQTPTQTYQIPQSSQVAQSPLNYIPTQQPINYVPAQPPLNYAQPQTIPYNIPTQPISSQQINQQNSVGQSPPISQEDLQKLKQIAGNPTYLSHYLNTPYEEQQNQFQARAQEYDDYYDPNLHFEANKYPTQEQKNPQNQDDYSQVDYEDYYAPKDYAQSNNEEQYKASSISLNGDDIKVSKGSKNLFKEMEVVMGNVDLMNPFQLIEQLLLDSDSDDEDDKSNQKIYDISNTSRQVKQMQLNQTVQLVFDAASLLIDEHILKQNYIVVLIKGNGSLKIAITDQGQSKVVKSFGKILNTKIEKEKRIVFQTKYLTKYLNNYFKFELESIFLGGSMSIIANAAQNFHCNFGEPIKLYTEFVHEIDVKIKLDPKTYISQNSRFQFVLKTNLGAEDLSGDEDVQLLINYQKDFPDQQKFDLLASGSTGTGLIKTINQKSPFFCSSKECYYTVKIMLNKIHQIVFLPSVLENGSEIHMKKDFSMIEELEIGEVIYYKLKIENPEKKSIFFTVTPKQNQTVLFVNPDEEEQDLNKSQYVTSSEGVQSIMITNKQIEHFQYSGQIFFLAFHNPDEKKISTFEFTVQLVEVNKQIEIEQAHFLSGVIIKQEIQNYIMNLYTGEQESFSLDFEMKNFKGKAKIAIKECKINEQICEVDEKDLENTDLKKNRLIVSKEVSEQNNQLELSFNCPGDDPFETKNKFVNTWPISDTCKFAVGLFAMDGKDEFVTYSLQVKGKNIMKNLAFGVSHNIAIFPFEYKQFHMILKNEKEIYGIKLKVVALYGKCDIFFSTTRVNPQEGFNDGKIIVDNENISSISLKNYDIALKFPSYQTTENLFIGIYAYEYTIIDIYSEEVFQDSLTQGLKDEILTNNKMAFRLIEEYNYLLDNNKVDIYYKNFKFITPVEYEKIESFNITINSNHLGLFICVQKGEDKFDFNKGCDYSSSTENLEVSGLGDKFKQKTQYNISIQKRMDKTKEEFHNFPIDFDILIHSKTEVNKIELLTPSVVHTKKIDSKQKFSFQVDITNWQRNGQIVLNTHDIDVKASIKQNIKDDKNIQVLDSSHYGISIDDSHSFKKKYCEHFRCKLFIVVENIGAGSARFSLSYIHDDMHYALKEGEQFFVPANKSVYLLGKVQKEKDVSFNFVSNYFQTVAYAIILETDFEMINQFHLGKLIDEEKFEFKSNIDNQSQILIKKENLTKFKKPILLFLLVPKFHYTEQKKTPHFTVLSELQKLRVSLDIDLKKLSPFTERVGSVYKGDFQYYHYVQDQPESLQIYLSEQSGECRLFLNKDFGNLPILTNFWLEAEGSGTKILDLSLEILKLNQAKDSFTIGVYGKTHCKYSILVQNGNSNLFRVEYQKVFNTTLGKDVFYFFDYYNSHKKFNALISSDSSDLQIDIMKYDPDDELNFFDVIKNKDYLMQSHVYKKGSPPWVFTDQSLFDYNLHFILRLRAMDQNTQIDLAIYDPLFPLEIPSKQSTFFALKENSSQMFVIHLSDDYQEADVEVKLSHGSIKFAYSDTKDFKNYQQLSKPGVKNMRFTDQNKPHLNDIKIFKQLFVTVQALEDSKFSIYVKPKKEFKQLKIFESDLVYPDPEDFTFVFFQVDMKIFHQIKELIFEVDHFRMYNQKIEYLFNSDDDVSLSAQNPFLPMPIKSNHVSMKFITLHEELNVEIKKGSYIFKIPPSKQKQGIKITASMNGRRQLNANGDYLFKQADVELEKEFDFAVYLPQKGDFRLSLETCQNMKIQNIFFSDSRAINTHQPLVQEYSFFYQDVTKKEKVNVQNLSVPILRYQNTIPGSITFSVFKEDYSLKEHFNLITEFKTEKELIVWKDYMDYFPMEKENFEVLFQKSQKDEKELLVKATLPKFKTQLYNDHPKIKYISVIYNVYLIPDENYLEKFLKCGMGALEEDKAIFKSSFSKIGQQQSANTVINVAFDQEHLKHVDSSKYLSVFAYLKISFIENDEDEYSITLDEKYTDVPFFIVMVENEYVSYFDLWLGKLFGDNLGFYGVIMLVLIFLGIWVIYSRNQKRREGYENVIHNSKNKYERGDNNSLEMT